MAAKIGILGEDTTLVKDTTITLYTVPASKAARVQILIMTEGPAGSHDYQAQMGTPNSEVTIRIEEGSGIDRWTGRQPSTTPDPAISINGTEGFMTLSAGLGDMDAASGGQRYIVAALDKTYFLSTGDTVTVRWGQLNLLDHLVQVVGVEDDA